jgi:hypothetical protein
MMWLLLAGIAFILLSSNKSFTAPPSSSISPTVTNPTIYNTANSLRNETKAELSADKISTPINPVIIGRIPKPGYAGPINGPFYWAGVGEPPDGQYTTIGDAVDEPPLGYGYDASRGLYQWVGYGAPPDDKYTLPLNFRLQQNY